MKNNELANIVKKICDDTGILPEEEYFEIAELIVNECATILDTKIQPPSHPFNSIGYKLKGHFGVE